MILNASLPSKNVLFNPPTTSPLPFKIRRVSVLSTIVPGFVAATLPDFKTPAFLVKLPQIVKVFGSTKSGTPTGASWKSAFNTILLLTVKLFLAWCSFLTSKFHNVGRPPIKNKGSSIYNDW